MAYVYLAGGIAGLSDEEAHGWRDAATFVLDLFKIQVYNPMVRDYRGRSNDHINEIVEEDKNDILKSDVVLCRAERSSWGTAMEIMFSYENKKPVIAFVGNTYNEISPWILYHTTTVISLADALQKVINIITGLSWPPEEIERLLHIYYKVLKTNQDIEMSYNGG